MTKPSIPHAPVADGRRRRHPWSFQIFIRIDVSRWVVMVAHDQDGALDPDGIIGFLACGNQAVNYHVNTWHHPLRVLDRPGRFAGLMLTTGVKANDESWSTLPELIRLEE